MPFLNYCRQRLADDPHLWAALFDEIIELGYQGGYSTFTRALRRHDVRPHCEQCQATKGRDVAVIAHPPGEEIQFDWLGLPSATSRRRPLGAARHGPESQLRRRLRRPNARGPGHFRGPAL
ncbi:hypothetical protein ACWEKM_29950 [Streptomyces sp. NPDC004752]